MKVTLTKKQIHFIVMAVNMGINSGQLFEDDKVIVAAALRKLERAKKHKKVRR